MKWQDEGIILGSISFGEKSQIVSVFTHHHGRHKGLFKSLPRQTVKIHSGSIADTSWHARLEEHLGLWKLEALFSPFASIINKPLAMHALLSAVALCEILLPEREPQPSLYEQFKNLLYAFRQEIWLKAYIRFELELIERSGFPLELNRCTVTGSTENLVYVSPRTGKAVSASAGLPYHDRLLKLPAFIPHDQDPDLSRFRDALDLTEYFLERYSLGIHGLEMPQARIRFKDYLDTQLRRENIL